MDDRIFKEITSLVKNGYEKAAISHSKEIDKTRTDFAIYKHFKSLILENVLELGCGNGVPIAIDLIKSNIAYTGIDISVKQIELANENVRSEKATFLVKEMLGFCQMLENSSVGGIISLFTIFHLPRIFHVQLFDQIFSVLQPGAPILFTCHPSKWQGFEENWLGAPKMFWSNFSDKWYQTTLNELGFDFIMKYRHITIFNSKKETQDFMLFRKPMHKKDQASFP